MFKTPAEGKETQILFTGHEGAGITSPTDPSQTI